MYNLKHLSKRGIALLLTFLMCLGMLNLSVFADNAANSGTVEYSNADWTYTEDGRVAHKKTAEKIGEDTFRITLSVKTLEEIAEQSVSPDAAVVIVIDVSNSMAWTVDGKTAWTDANKRITKAKAAAKNFIDAFAQDAGDATRKVAIVEFGSNAMTVQSWTNTTTAKSAVDKVEINFSYQSGRWTTYDEGGTNIEAGLMLASNLLTDSSVSGIENKYVVMITDGVPTFHVNNTSTSTSFISGVEGGGDSAAKADYEDVPTVASGIKSQAQLYTVSYGKITDKVGTQTIDQWLSSFATKNIAAGTDIDFGLTSISTIIANQAKAWLLTDPIPKSQFIVFDPGDNTIPSVDVNPDSVLTYKETNDGVELCWNLKDELSTTETEGSQTWHVYETSYTVHLDTSAEDFVEGQAYAANGTTTLTYMLTNDGELDETLYSTSLDVPKISGKTPSVGYTVKYLYKDKETGEYVEDSKLQIKENTKLWTTVELDKERGEKNGYSFQSGDTTVRVTADGMVFELKYDPIPASLTVRHHLITITETDEGTETVYDGVKKTETVNGFLGETYTATPLDNEWTLVDSVTTDDGETYTTDDYRNVDLEQDGGTIDLYYTVNVEERTPVEVTVNYFYRTNEWKLNEDGKYEFVKADYPADANDTTTTSGHFLNDLFTAAEKDLGEYTLDSVVFNDTTQFTLSGKLDQTDNTVNVYYEKDAQEEPETAAITIIHEYYEATGVNSEKVLNDAYTIYEEEAEEAYVGETWTATDMSGENGGGWTRTTDDSAMSTVIKSGDNTIYVRYERDSRAEATVEVVHSYTTRTYFINDDGEVDYKESSFEVTETPAGPYRAGDSFQLAAQLTPEKDGQTYSLTEESAGKPGLKTLVEGENFFDLHYVREVRSSLGEEVSVTVTRHYKTYRSYVDDNGSMVVNKEEDDGTAFGGVYTGYVDEVISVADSNDNVYNEVEYEEADGNVWTVKIVDGYEHHVYYQRFVSELEEASVSVQPIFKTYTTSIDEATGEEVRELTETDDSAQPIALGTTWYVGQAIGAVNPDNYGKPGFTYDPQDEENYTPEFVSADAEANVIYLVYSQEATDFTPVTVLVYNHYTTLTKHVVDGEYAEDTTETTSGPAVYENYRMYEFFDTTGKGEAMGYDVDETQEQPADSIQLTESLTVVDFYWYREVDQTIPVTVEVVHHYMISDKHPDVEIQEWTVGEGELIEGKYAGETYVATANDLGIFDGYTTAIPEEALEQPGITLVEGNNRIDIYYELENDSRAQNVGVKVIHEYYRNMTALEQADAVSVYEENFTAIETDSFTAASRDVEGEDYRVYDYAPSAVITVDADAENNVIVIRYVRTNTTYTVVHEYYTDGTLTGSVSNEYAGQAGDVVTADSITKLTAFNDLTYTFRADQSDSDIALVEGTNGALTLRYYYSTSTPDIDDEEEEEEPGNTDNNDDDDDDDDDDTPVITPPDDDDDDDDDDTTVVAPSDGDDDDDDDVIDIDEPDVPLADLPDEDVPLADIPDEDVPLASEPDEVIDLEEEDVPLADLPEELVDLEDEGVPLDAVPQTGDKSHTALWGTLSALSLGGIALALPSKKREEQE